MTMKRRAIKLTFSCLCCHSILEYVVDAFHRVSLLQNMNLPNSLWFLLQRCIWSVFVKMYGNVYMYIQCS